MVSHPVGKMYDAWHRLAENHRDRYKSVIGDDGVLGPAWEQIGDSLRTLLNGDCGGLDCGTVDGLILDTMTRHGVDTSEK